MQIHLIVEETVELQRCPSDASIAYQESVSSDKERMVLGSLRSEDVARRFVQCCNASSLQDLGDAKRRGMPVVYQRTMFFLTIHSDLLNIG
jgi:hypothetical protein